MPQDTRVDKGASVNKPKTLLAFDEQARWKIQRGVDALAEAAKVTLGPLGRNVALDVKGKPPLVTHDGMAVANGIDLPDIFEQMSNRLLRQAATSTKDAVGDGSTTTIVLAQAILRESLRLTTAGANPAVLASELQRAAATFDRALGEMAVPARGQEIYERIAAVASGDRTLGRLLGESMAWTGSEGTIAIIEGRTSSIEVETTEGFLFDRGFLSPHFITDEREEAVVDDPAILLTDQTVTVMNDLVPILEQLIQVGKRDFVLVARDVTGEALAMLVQNKVHGVLNALAVKAPEFDERRTAALEDLALVTGATLLASESGRRLNQATLDDLGRAQQVISRRNRTTVVGGRGKMEAVNARLRQIKNELEGETVRFHREKLEARLMRLGGRVVEIRVGGPTALAIKDTKTRLGDAHHALLSAVQEGVVPGGGVALLNATGRYNGPATSGAAILGRALEQPLRQLAANAGVEGSVIVAEVRRRQCESGNPHIGYDVLGHRYVDLLDVGIVDPVRVVRAALRHAASISAMLLTSDTLVALIPIDEKERRRKQVKPWPGLAAGH